VADCKTNEVEVPNVVGLGIERARVRLNAQPLTPLVIYKPALPGERVGVVLRQFPKTGTLASFGRVRLVLAKALHGVVPKIVGLDEQQARTLLETRKLEVTIARVHTKKGKAGRVLAQKPAGGVAAAPGMTVRLTVAAGG
jgi:serine/threonine-protein kinase